MREKIENRRVYGMGERGRGIKRSGRGKLKRKNN